MASVGILYGSYAANIAAASNKKPKRIILCFRDLVCVSTSRKPPTPASTEIGGLRYLRSQMRRGGEISSVSTFDSLPKRASLFNMSNNNQRCVVLTFVLDCLQSGYETVQ